MDKKKIKDTLFFIQKSISNQRVCEAYFHARTLWLKLIEEEDKENEKERENKNKTP